MVLYMVIYIFELNEILIIFHPQIVVLDIFNILKDLALFLKILFVIFVFFASFVTIGLTFVI
jgi:hypothetical protein